MSLKSFLATTLLLALLPWTGTALAGTNEWTTAGPYGGDVPVLVADPATPGTLYAGTSGGVFKSTDGAGTWAAASRGLPVGTSIAALLLDPSEPATLFAAVTGFPGVFRSPDGGRHWRPFSTGFPPDAAINALAAGTGGSPLYAATTPHGLFRSTDGGVSWQAAGGGSTDVRSIAVAAGRAALYTATGDGVFKSSDGGASWQALTLGLDPGAYDKIVADPSIPTTLYALVFQQTSKLFKTSDGGGTWQRITFAGSSFVRDLAIDPASSSVLYAATSSNSNVFKSTDGGDTWSDGSDGISAIILRSVRVDPHDSRTVYAGTDLDHGVFKSTDGGVRWKAVNQGLTNTEVQDLAVDPSDSSRVLASSENGVFRSLDGGGSWSASGTGLENVAVSSLAFDPRNPSTVFAGSSPFLFPPVVYRTLDGGDAWQPATGPFQARGSIDAIAIDPEDPRIVYATNGDALLKSTDGGDTWTDVDTPGNFVLDLVLAPSSPATLYLTTISFSLSSRIWRTTDGGATWSAADGGLPGGFITLSLDVDPTDAGKVYASGLGGVYRSSDGGASWRPTAALPGGFSTDVAIDPRAPRTLYAATAGGVRKSVDGGDAWYPLGDPLPQLAFDLEVDPRDSAVVHAGTQNGGVFTITQDFDCVPGATTLCIDDEPGDRRFEVSLEFETELGGYQLGDARATSLAELGITRGGILSFFGTANPEVLVKVIDGCGFNGHFWVFYAATTTVGFDLRVTDTLAGVSRIYSNPDRTTAATITDIEAFPECGSGGPIPPRAATERPASFLTPAATAGAPARADDLARSGKGTGTCVSGATTLCIDDQPGDRRFRVTGTFDTVLGGAGTGDAEAVSLAPLGITRGGILSFFDARNPEVLVKVLDGCGFNDRFWIFFAATTNAGFTLRVEDTLAGIERVFVNPDQNAALPVTEIDGFATCDL